LLSKPSAVLWNAEGFFTACFLPSEKEAGGSASHTGTASQTLVFEPPVRQPAETSFFSCPPLFQRRLTVFLNEGFTGGSPVWVPPRSGIRPEVKSKYPASRKRIGLQDRRSVFKLRFKGTDFSSLAGADFDGTGTVFRLK
jgi:hypothetical protein